jgi:hypothetical protein
MITASKIAIAIAVAALAAATVDESSRPQLKRQRRRRRLTCSIGRMATVATLSAPTEPIHTRTEATHTRTEATHTPPIPIAIPTPGIPGMVIIEMARPEHHHRHL